MDAQVRRLLDFLNAWRDRPVTVTMTWTRQEPSALLRFEGVLGEVGRRREPVQEDDDRVHVSAPVGEACVLTFDSYAVVQVEYAAATVTIQLHDDLTVVLALA